MRVDGTCPKMAIELVHIERVDLSEIRKVNLIVAGFFKIINPDLYKSPKKTAELK
jgi:hypothetical protein